MRITNLRKQYAKKEELKRKQAEAEAEVHALESKSDFENTDDAKKASSEQENISSDENPPT